MDSDVKAGCHICTLVRSGTQFIINRFFRLYLTSVRTILLDLWFCFCAFVFADCGTPFVDLN
jgi:hypothetical protein